MVLYVTHAESRSSEGRLDRIGFNCAARFMDSDGKIKVIDVVMHGVFDSCPNCRHDYAIRLPFP